MNWDAPDVLCKPLDIMFLKSETRKTLSKGEHFIPVCQYPPSVDVRDREVGAIVRFGRDGIEIKAVIRRVISRA